jgi:hypothetical protein
LSFLALLVFLQEIQWIREKKILQEKYYHGILNNQTKGSVMKINVNWFLAFSVCVFIAALISYIVVSYQTSRPIEVQENVSVFDAPSKDHQAQATEDFTPASQRVAESSDEAQTRPQAPANDLVAESVTETEGSPSTNDFPEHLLCPEKWVGVYISAIDEDEAEYTEVEQRMHAVAREIIENHNPNRPLAEVWPLFIEEEKRLYAQSEDAGKFTVLNIGANRIDWTYEQMRNFPEIFELIFEEGFDGQWANVYQVEMGSLDPDWNLTTLPDGREFRVKNGYRYQIHVGDELAGGMFEISLSDLKTAKLIVIDNLEQTSDTELERLGGWNYNINPYTNEATTQ